MKISYCPYCNQSWHYASQCFYKPRHDSHPCKWCKSKDHLSWQCFKNPKREQQFARKIKKGQHGRVAKDWIKVRNLWFKENRADTFICYLCGKLLARNETTLDHIESRSRRPDLRYDLNNLAPCCWKCNQQKGSKSYTQFTP